MNVSPILKLSSLNIGGLSRTKIDHLVMLAGGHPQVICLQETHSSSPSAVADLSQELANFRLFHSQNKEEKYAAVSILINRSWTVEDVKLAWKIEGRAIAMQIKVQNRLFLLVNTYAPAKPAERVEFLEKLSEKLSNQQTIYDNIMIIGDFNFIENAVLDRISTHNTAAAISKARRGHTAMEQIKTNMHLKDIFRTNRPNEVIHTCINRANGTKSRIDRCYGTTGIIENFVSMSVRQFLHLDHKYVEYEIEGSGLVQAMGKGYWKMNTLDIQDAGQHMCRILDDFRAAGPEVAEWWDDFKQRIKVEFKQISKQRVQQEKAEQERIEHEIRKTRQSTVPQRDKDRLEAILEKKKYNTKYKLLLGQRYHMERIDQLSLKSAKAISKLNATNRYIYGIRNAAGKVVREVDSISDELTGQYQKLFKSEGIIREEAYNILDKTPELINRQDRNTMDEPITEKEIKKAMDEMQNRKTPGLDGIPVEFYKKFSKKLVPILKNLFMDILRKGRLPKSMYLGVISLLHKGGDRNERKNYRPVTLSNVDYKILAKVLTNRVGKLMDKVIHKDQSSGVKGRNIQDAAFFINSVISKCQVDRKTGILLSVDQMAAFDRVEWEYLNLSLRKFGFSENFLKWISIIYKKGAMKAKLLVNGNVSQGFCLTRGVRQGCPLSPLLYVLAIETLANYARSMQEPAGLQVGVTECKMSLYADDTNYFLEKFEDVEKIFKMYEKFGKASGGKLKIEKTKLLLLGGKTDIDCPNNMRNYIVDKIKIYGYTYDSFGTTFAENFEKFKDLLKDLRPPTEHSSYLSRIKALNTYVYSGLWYNMYAASPPDRFLKEVENKTEKYVWAPYRGRMVKMAIQKLPIDLGGLKFPDLVLKKYTFRLMFLIKYKTQQVSFASFFEHYWRIMQNIRNKRQLENSNLPAFYKELWMAVKLSEIKLDGSTVKFGGKEYEGKKIKSKDMYRHLVIRKHQPELTFFDHEMNWDFELNTVVAENKWKEIRKSRNLKLLASPKAKNTHYRLQNRAVWPNAKFERATDLEKGCDYCRFYRLHNELETITHRHLECHRALNIWNVAEQWLQELHLSVGVGEKMFGYCSGNSRNTVLANLIIMEVQHVLWNHLPKVDIRKNRNHDEQLKKHLRISIKRQIRKAFRIMEFSDFKKLFGAENVLVSFNGLNWSINI